MHGYINRVLTADIKSRLSNFPVVAIIGPHQSGKSTIAKHYLKDVPQAIYLDLERPKDLNMLRDPETFFDVNAGKLICLDEIQRKPDLFPILRSIIDENNRNGQLLILGSASPNLLKQSSESLAGRITYLELTPFLLNEVSKANNMDKFRKLWLCGGYPRSYLASDEESSLIWRTDFVRTFLERDIPALGIRIAQKNIERFWTMCAHVTGQVLNNSKLAGSLGVSGHTIRSYVDILENTFVLRVLAPYERNIKKRLIKSPKIYIRDTGIMHALLNIETINDLLGSPHYGSSWEAFAIENVLSNTKFWKPYFYRTSTGVEIDLVLEKGNKRIAIEFKVSSAPALGKGFWNALDTINPEDCWIIAPVKEHYTIEKGIKVGSPMDFIKWIRKRPPAKI